jgi:uncharacterized protein (TIGR00299 family) protein
METLAFDGRTGASGDMLLGALLAAGADREALAPIEAALPVDYRVETVTKNGISATSVAVLVEGESEHEAAGSHGHHRSYSDVRDIVAGLDVPAAVERDVLAVVDRLADAEAAVHGTTVDEIHFHEVGADDAIADIVGVAALLADLDPDRVVTTPVAAGGGTVTMHHGTYPVPAPAVVKLAEEADWDLRGGPVDVELLTPTGAALLAQFADGVEHLPAMEVMASGYGAGSRDLEDRPNVLRALRGEARGLQREEISVLETTVDDTTPEVLGSLHETLREVGAKDVFVTPVTMKKSRPGHNVSVVVAPEDAERVARRLAAETGTLGVRERGVRHRWTAERAFETVSVTLDGAEYAVTVKVARDTAGDVLDVSAEFEDATRVADAAGVPVRDVLAAANAAWRAG